MPQGGKSGRLWSYISLVSCITLSSDEIFQRGRLRQLQLVRFSIIYICPIQLPTEIRVAAAEPDETVLGLVGIRIDPQVIATIEEVLTLVCCETIPGNI